MNDAADDAVLLPDDAARDASALLSCGNDSSKLVRAANVDPSDFLRFLRETGLFRDKDALELLEEAQRLAQEGMSIRTAEHTSHTIDPAVSNAHKHIERLERRVRALTPISVKQLARYETHEGLARVIVIAHVLEEPSEDLFAAVLKNFNRGKPYYFFVSIDSFAKRGDEFRAWFQHIYHAATKGKGLYDFDFLFRLRALGRDWDDFPYVFYEMERGGEGSGSKIVGFRGSQAFNGIANDYFRIPERYARAIANSFIYQLAESQVGSSKVEEQANSHS